MADLYLVRHGQASFGAENYDALSALGHEQARSTGQFLSSFLPSANVYAGSLVRQNETLQGLVDGGLKSHSVTVMDAFNELDHEALLIAVCPEFADKQAFARLLANESNPKGYFHGLYQEALYRWIQADEHDDAYGETHDGFRDRVLAGIDHIAKCAESDVPNVLVTSAGPISVCLHQVLGIEVKTSFDLNEQIANASITHIKFNSAGRRTLASFNGFQHLQMANVKVTYR